MSKSVGELRGAFAEYLKGFDLIPPQKGIMTLLKAEGPLCQAFICKVLVINKATMVRFLDHLEELELINRSPSSEDRREKIVSLTKKGEKLIVKLEKKNAELEVEYFSDLTSKEIESLNKILLKIHSPFL